MPLALFLMCNYILSVVWWCLVVNLSTVALSLELREEMGCGFYLKDGFAGATMLVEKIVISIIQ